jgi:hypothetical protein
MVWLIAVGLYGLTVLLAWSLCRAGAQDDTWSPAGFGPGPD